MDEMAALDDTVLIDEGSHSGGRDIEGRRIDVTKHRTRAHVLWSRRGKEREWRGNHLIARSYIQRHQRQQQSVRPGGNANADAGAAILSDLSLEPANVLPQDELLTRADAVDERHYFRANLGKLRLKIE
jgi:hypothetical protein